MLWYWLAWGEAHCQGLDRHLHYVQRPEFELREAARAEFEALTGNDEWLDSEAGRGGGEPIVCP